MAGTRVWWISAGGHAGGIARNSAAPPKSEADIHPAELDDGLGEGSFDPTPRPGPKRSFRAIATTPLKGPIV